MANGVTSEWEDIHVRLGNYMSRPVQISQQQLYEQAQEKLDNKQLQDYLDEKDIQQIRDLEDEFMNDEFFETYKFQRLMQINQNTNIPYFGEVREISRNDYIQEVTNASIDVWVVLHLYQPYNQASNLVNLWLSTLASKYMNTKFVKIIADRCTENFPDSCIPALLLYKNKQMITTINSLDKKINFTQKGLELLLHKYTVINNPEFEYEAQDQQDINQQQILKNPFKKSYQSSLQDPLDDREYVNQSMKLHKFI